MAAWPREPWAMVIQCKLLKTQRHAALFEAFRVQGCTTYVYSSTETRQLMWSRDSYFADMGDDTELLLSKPRKDIPSHLNSLWIEANGASHAMTVMAPLPGLERQARVHQHLLDLRAQTGKFVRTVEVDVTDLAAV